MQSSKVTRHYYLDHMRGFIIALVLLQHSVQGYAQEWGGRWWFIDIPERSAIMDVMFNWTDGFIMQAMFFLAGIFALPSLYRRGWLSFTGEKMARLFIPMVVGIAILVPPLRYIKYEATEEPGISYLEYWFDVFLKPDELSPAGFWFLAFLLIMLFSIALLDFFIPVLTRWLGQLTAWLAKHPLIGYLLVSATAATLIGYSDIMYGTRWWMGLGNLFEVNRNSWTWAFLRIFSARSNMLYSYIFFFILGVGIAKSEILSKTDLMEKASKHWLTWLGLTVILSVTYAWYIQTHLFSGAYSDDIRYYFRQGGTLSSAWPLIQDVAPALLIRTTLHGFLCTAQIFTVMILLYRFTNNTNISYWASLGACSYGMFFVHEPIAVWSQYLLGDTNIPPFLKMLVVFSIVLSLSWFITAKILRKLPITRRIF